MQVRAVIRGPPLSLCVGGHTRTAPKSIGTDRLVVYYGAKIWMAMSIAKTLYLYDLILRK